MSALKRTLSLSSTIAILIGGVIGSGIFMKPSLMLSQLGSPLLLLSVWVVAGMITLFGALSNAELAALFPQTGGQLVFFQKIYGEGFAFVYGWASFAVFNTGGNASIAYVCAQYLQYFVELPRFSPGVEHSLALHVPYLGTIFPLENIGVKSLTILLILLFSYISYRSVACGSGLQKILTLLKAVAIALLIGGVFLSGKGSLHHLQEILPSSPHGWALIGAYAAALGGAFWAYDGWNNISFIAGEIRDPQKNIPKAAWTGIGFCIVVYLLINLACLYMLSPSQMAASGFVASDTARVSWGMAGGTAVALLVILSTLGTTNANVLATARVTFALGKQSSLFRWAASEQRKHHTPGNALWLNACWSVLLILSGSFDMLTDMLIFVSWFFYGMSALGVLILRKTLKDAPRPYRVWGYPAVPLIFVGFTVFFLCSSLYNDVLNYQTGAAPVVYSLLGLLITCMGIPLYFISGKRK